MCRMLPNSIPIFNTHRENKKPKKKSRKYVNLMKICELLLVFVALLLAVSMEKWKSCTSLSIPFSLTPSVSLSPWLQLRNWVWVWAWVVLLLHCSHRHKTNRIFGHGSTRLLFKQVWGINHALHQLLMPSSSSFSSFSHASQSESKCRASSLLGFPMRTGPH